MVLLLAHPEVARRSCEHCQRVIYGDDGRPMRNPVGDEIPRAAANPPPCRTHVGCPKGTPEQARTLDARNERFYRAYQRARLTGRWPEDEWFLALATDCYQIEETVRRADAIRGAEMTGQAAAITALNAALSR